MRLCSLLFKIFFPFLCLDTWVNIRAFCFSSEGLQLISSYDVNKKYYTKFHWFPNNLLYIDHGNTKFSYIYTTEMRKSSPWKTSRWNAPYTINYTVNKNNKKKTIIKTIGQNNWSFHKISSKRNNFINYN